RRCRSGWTYWPFTRWGLVTRSTRLRPTRYNSLTTFFFFSSRRRHTSCLSDWSSDVCSSDLAEATAGGQVVRKREWLRCTDPEAKIGRASCRERGWIAVGAVAPRKQRESSAAKGRTGLPKRRIRR